MSKFQNKYRVESARRPGWDYSANGYYFLTICTKNRETHFGKIINGIMNLSEIGEIANQYWMEIPDHFPFIELDEYVIMPNHIHGILVINNTRHAGNENHGRDVACNVSTTETPTSNDMKINKNPAMTAISPKNGSLSTIIRSFKSACTKTINERFINNDFAWQSRFHDRIIRDDLALEYIRQYIIKNPANWANDELYS